MLQGHRLGGGGGRAPSSTPVEKNLYYTSDHSTRALKQANGIIPDPLYQYKTQFTIVQKTLCRCLLKINNVYMIQYQLVCADVREKIVGFKDARVILSSQACPAALRRRSYLSLFIFYM